MTIGVAPAGAADTGSMNSRAAVILPSASGYAPTAVRCRIAWVAEVTDRSMPMGAKISSSSVRSKRLPESVSMMRPAMVKPGFV